MPITKKDKPQYESFYYFHPKLFSLKSLLQYTCLNCFMASNSFPNNSCVQLYFLIPSQHYLANQYVLNPNYVRSIQEFRWTTVPMPACSASPSVQSSLTDYSWRAHKELPVLPVPCLESGFKSSSTNSPTCDSVLVSPQSSSGPICRICHEGDYKEELVAPCHCAGTMGLVHQLCIEKWLSSSNSDSCEICKYVFVTCKKPRPYIEWLQEPSNPSDLRNLAADLLCFILLSPLAAISMYLCFVGARHYNSYRMRWEATGLVSLALFLLAIYGIWSYVTIRYHLNVIREWRKTHKVVKLLQMRRGISSLHVMKNIANNDSNSTQRSISLSSSITTPSITLEMPRLSSTPHMKHSDSYVARVERVHITTNVMLRNILLSNHLLETTL